MAEDKPFKRRLFEKWQPWLRAGHIIGGSVCGPKNLVEVLEIQERLGRILNGGFRDVVVDWDRKVK